MNELIFTDQPPEKDGNFYFQSKEAGSIVITDMQMRLSAPGFVDDAGNWSDFSTRPRGRWLEIPTAPELVALGERMARMENALALAGSAFDELERYDKEFAASPLMRCARVAIQEARKA